MKHLLDIKDPEFYINIDNSWLKASSTQIRRVMLQVATDNTKGITHNIRVKDANENVVSIRPDGVLDGELDGFAIDAELTLKMLHL